MWFTFLPVAILCFFSFSCVLMPNTVWVFSLRFLVGKKSSPGRQPYTVQVRVVATKGVTDSRSRTSSVDILLPSVSKGEHNACRINFSLDLPNYLHLQAVITFLGALLFSFWYDTDICHKLLCLSYIWLKSLSGNVSYFWECEPSLPWYCIRYFTEVLR